MGPKGNGDMQAEGTKGIRIFKQQIEIKIRHLPAVGRLRRYGR